MTRSTTDSAGSTAVSIVVLPFENRAAEAAGEPDYFTRGFAEDLTTDLSRFPQLDVIAGHSAAQLASRDAQSAPLPVDYVLEGSVRRDSGTLRITAQLLTPDRRVVWSERYDRALAELFAVQDEITAHVVASISSRLDATLLSAARRKPITELDAYDAWLRGTDELRAGTLAADRRARELFQQAIARDPAYSRAHLGMSLTYFNEWSCQLWHRWDENERLAYRHALRANELDDNDHYARVVLGRILLFRREFALAERHFERALSLNRNDADSLVQLAMGFGFLGQPERARELYERAIVLNPCHEPWYPAYTMIAAFVQEDWAQVIECASSAPADTMVDLSAYRAIAHYRLGDTPRARKDIATYLGEFEKKIATGRDVQPGEALRWALHVNPYRRSRDLERMAQGLRELGLEGPAPLRAAIETPPSQRVFRRVGSVWQVRFAGRDAHLPHLKGCVDLATLLSRPGEEIHCLELMGGTAEGGADDAIDAQARAAYRARIAELRQDLATAESDNDLGRAGALREELDALSEHLGKALGLGGRSRKLGAPAERARSAVTWRIRSALTKLEDVHPSLAEHLRESIQTGTFCSYAPTHDEAEAWAL